MPKEPGLVSGARGKEVERLQVYLGKFGYLESPVLDEFRLRSPITSSPPVAEKGIFDDATVQAVKGKSLFLNVIVRYALPGAA